MTAFYGLHYFGLRRLTFHALNRFYLLASLALSLTIPMLSYEREEVIFVEPKPAIEKVYSEEISLQSLDNQAFNMQSQVATAPTFEIDFMQVLTIIYLAGMVVFLAIFIRNVAVILISISDASATFSDRNRSEDNEKNKNLFKSVAERSRSDRFWRIFYTTKHFTNSSFFNYIFINPDNLNPHEEALVIAHESHHARQLHTLDLLLLGVLKAVFWFNPIIYFYQKSLKQIHEYEVDTLMSATHDSHEYAHLLLKLGVAPNSLIINQFSTKPLSDRIQFLFKKPTQNMKKLLYFLSLPILAVGVTVFAQEKIKTVYREKVVNKTIFKPAIEAKILPEIVSKKRIVKDTLKNEQIIQIDSSKFTKLLSMPMVLPDDYQIYSDDILLVAGTNYIKKDYRIYLNKEYHKLKVKYSSSDKIYILSFEKSKPSNLMIYPELTKLKEISYPMLKSGKGFTGFLASTSNLSNTFAYNLNKQKLPTVFSQISRNQDTLRTIIEANKLGKNPLVIIDGVEYPSSILYNINPKHTKGSTIYAKSSQRAIEKYGLRAEDGVIILESKGNFMINSAQIKQIITENIRRQLNAPNGKLVRVEQLNEDGSTYDKLILRNKSGNDVATIDVLKGGKIELKIDGKKVSEQDFINYDGEYERISSWEAHEQHKRKNGSILGGFNIKTKLK